MAIIKWVFWYSNRLIVISLVLFLRRNLFFPFATSTRALVCLLCVLFKIFPFPGGYSYESRHVNPVGLHRVGSGRAVIVSTRGTLECKRRKSTNQGPIPYCNWRINKNGHTYGTEPVESLDGSHLITQSWFFSVSHHAQIGIWYPYAKTMAFIRGCRDNLGTRHPDLRWHAQSPKLKQLTTQITMSGISGNLVASPVGIT